MTTTAENNWPEANQRYLVAALAEVRLLLERHIASSQSDATVTVQEDTVKQDIERAYSNMPAPPALDTLCALFGLSPFERKMLLLCTGIELDGSFASLCAAAQGDPRRTYPTFSLALAAFPDAHWSALIPDAPLRYWKLVEIANSMNKYCTISPGYPKWTSGFQASLNPYIFRLNRRLRMNNWQRALPRRGQKPPLHQRCRLYSYAVMKKRINIQLRPQLVRNSV